MFYLNMTTICIYIHLGISTLFIYFRLDISTIGISYWHLLLMLTCVLLPAQPLILTYVIQHLKIHALDQNTELGKLAQFAIEVSSEQEVNVQSTPENYNISTNQNLSVKKILINT